MIAAAALIEICCEMIASEALQARRDLVWPHRVDHIGEHRVGGAQVGDGVFHMNAEG
jgi:hypothetical protein